MLSSSRIARYKNAVLGRRYELSLTTVSAKRMRQVSKMYRGKDRATDILSFPLSKNSGEILLCLSEVKTHAKEFGMKSEQYLPYLVIHGMVHLKGLDHGRIMDRLETALCKKLKLARPDQHTPKKNGTSKRSRH